MFRSVTSAIVLSVSSGAALSVPALAQGAFPYEQEMMLDARPMPGGKRVPMIEVTPDGRAQVDLWCKSGPALVTIVDDTIVVTLGPMPEVQCPPARAQADEQVAAALSQVAQWRTEGDVLVLLGPDTTLRFRLSSH